MPPPSLLGSLVSSSLFKLICKDRAERSQSQFPAEISVCKINESLCYPKCPLPQTLCLRVIKHMTEPQTACWPHPPSLLSRSLQIKEELLNAVIHTQSSLKSPKTDALWIPDIIIIYSTAPCHDKVYPGWTSAASVHPHKCIFTFTGCCPLTSC